MRGKCVISKGNDEICLGSHTLPCLAGSKCLDKYFQTFAVSASMTCKKFFFRSAMSYKAGPAGDRFLFKR